jgi:GH35 family endo-1,4-beta-xylanase
MELPVSRWLLLVGIVLGTTPGGQAAPAPSDADLLAGADTRIEKHRKADAAIVVVDAAGRPLSNAKIDVEQTRHAFLFGCNIFLWGSLPNETTEQARSATRIVPRPGLPDSPPGEKLEQAYRRRFADLLNYATLPFYWAGYERERGKPDHERIERIARWCQQHGIRTKGHPLAWNCSDAAWFPSDPDELYRLQLGRIDDCVRRFAGLIDRWDVVNEATEFERVSFLKIAPKHSAMWKKVGQIEFIRQCLLRARAANPKATLLVNDYYTGPAFERLLEQLADEHGHLLCNTIGIQSHMIGRVWPPKETWRVCQQFSRFALPLHFTETTIISGDRLPKKKGDWPSTPEGEARQAREVAGFYTLLFSHPAVEAITWWDLSDWHSWLEGGPAGLLRSDMTPKPAYEELKRLVKGKWWTKTELRSGADGTAAFRGFLGDYQLTVRRDGKAAVVKKVSLARGKANRFTIPVP